MSKVFTTKLQKKIGIQVFDFVPTLDIEIKKVYKRKVHLKLCYIVWNCKQRMAPRI